MRMRMLACCCADAHSGAAHCAVLHAGAHTPVNHASPMHTCQNAAMTGAQQSCDLFVGMYWALWPGMSWRNGQRMRWKPVGIFGAVLLQGCFQGFQCLPASDHKEMA